MPGMPSSLAGASSQSSKLPLVPGGSYPSFRHELTEQGVTGETVAAPVEPAAMKGYHPLPGEQIRFGKFQQHHSLNKRKKRVKGIGGLELEGWFPKWSPDGRVTVDQARRRTD